MQLPNIKVNGSSLCAHIDCQKHSSTSQIDEGRYCYTWWTSVHVMGRTQFTMFSLFQLNEHSNENSFS